MRALYPGIGLASLCQLLGKSRQAYYHGLHSKSRSMAFDSVVAELAVETRQKIGNNKLGTRKLLPLINEQLDKQGIKVSRDRLFSIMEAYNLKIRKRRSKKPVTTNSEHGFRRYPNLVKDLTPKRAEKLWVSDITYIKVQGRFMYLSLITDAYSRKIMGYRLHEDLSVEGPLKALMMALSNRQYPNSRLIHHSDQGIQYCSHTYINMLKTHGIAISMASRSSPHENALAERVNGILKQEYGLAKHQDSVDKAQQSLQLAIESYNRKRPHQSLNGQTPEQVHNVKAFQDLDTQRQTKSGLTQQV